MVQIDMEKPSACRWTDEENNIHSCPLLDREGDCLLQGHVGYWSWVDQYKNCPLNEVTIDSDTESRPQIYCKDCKLRHNQPDNHVWLPCRAVYVPDMFSCIHAESYKEGSAV